MKWFARAGYAARGLVYLVIGVLAFLAITGAGEPAGTRDALSTLMSAPAGYLIAYVLAAGLLFYSLWRFTQSILDTDSHGHDAKGLAIRAGLLVSGLSYLALAGYAVSLRLGSGSQGGGGSGGGGDGYASMFSQFVGNHWTAGIIALVLAGVGVAHFIKALGERYAEHLLAEADKMAFIDPIAKTGLIARGIVFFILAFLFGMRAWRGEEAESAGSERALQFIQGLPLGGYLLAAMGAGLICFALYSFVEAWYRRVNLSEAKDSLQDARRAAGL